MSKNKLAATSQLYWPILPPTKIISANKQISLTWMKDFIVIAGVRMSKKYPVSKYIFPSRW